VLIAGDQALLRRSFRVQVDSAGVRVLMLVARGVSNAETAANVQVSLGESGRRDLLAKVNARDLPLL
jgi:hypothetical protein